MINGVSTYTRAKGGPQASPFGYQGNLLAQGIKSNFVNSLLNAPNKNIYDMDAIAAVPDIISAVTGNDDSSDKPTTTTHELAQEIQEKLPTGGNGTSSKINSTPADLAKAKNAVTDATTQNTGNTMADKSQEVAGQSINDKLQQIADSNNPSADWKQATEEPFYKNSNFYSALLAMGIALMSRSSPIAALQLAMNVKHKGETKDMLNANMDMLKKTYDPASVMAAMQSGDISKLKAKELTPLQKAEMDMAVKEQEGKDALANQEKLSDYNFGHQKELERIKQGNALALARQKASASGGVGDLGGMQLKANATPTERYEFNQLINKKSKTDKDYERLESLTSNGVPGISGMEPKDATKVKQYADGIKSDLTPASKQVENTQTMLDKADAGLLKVKTDLANRDYTAARGDLLAIEDPLSKALTSGTASITPEIRSDLQSKMSLIGRMAQRVSSDIGKGTTDEYLKQLNSISDSLERGEAVASQKLQNEADRRTAAALPVFAGNPAAQQALVSQTFMGTSAQRNLPGFDKNGILIQAAQTGTLPTSVQKAPVPQGQPVTVKYQDSDGKVHTINTNTNKLSKKDGQIYITINGQDYPLIKTK